MNTLTEKVINLLQRTIFIGYSSGWKLKGFSALKSNINFFFEDQKEIGKIISVRSSSLLKQCHLLLAIIWFPLDINVLNLNQDAEQPVKGELQKALKKGDLCKSSQ